MNKWLLNGTAFLAAMFTVICVLPYQANANPEYDHWAKNNPKINFTAYHDIWHHYADSHGNQVSSSGGYNIAVGDGYRKYSPTETDPLLMLGYTEEKYALVFGSVKNSVYQSAAEAGANMVTITIDVWQLSSSGGKYAAKRQLTVNKAIADKVQAIFKEIFEGQERFPIYSVGGYAWRPENTSEHRWGLAVDINPNENYMIRSNGVIVAGSFWDPGKSPYSISPTGDVVKAFNKYGFTWGGTWRSSNDYMHFSYLGR